VSLANVLPTYSGYLFLWSKENSAQGRALTYYAMTSLTFQSGCKTDTRQLHRSDFRSAHFFPTSPADRFPTIGYAVSIGILLIQKWRKAMSNKSNDDNHSNQLNSNNDAYWESRGYDDRPDDWANETSCTEFDD
jgi:hypothetical protein